MTKSVKFANLIIISGTVICIALILIALSIRGSSPSGSLLKYFITPVPFLLVLVAVLYRCSDKQKINIVLIFLFIGISIYIIEILLSLVSPFLTLKKNKEVPVNSRSKFQIMMDLRENGINAYTHIFPFSNVSTDGLNYEGIRIFPLGAISDKTTVFCKKGINEPVIYETDEHGFRNPKGLYNLDNLDVALIGDSFTQGHCVKNGDDIAGQLRTNNRKVLNLGMEASGPLIELAILSEYAKPYQPKYVFWLYWEGNDMPNLGWEKTPTLIKYLDHNFSQNLIDRQELVDSALISDVEKKIAIKAKDHAEKKEVIEISNANNITMSFKNMMLHILKLNSLRMKTGLHRNCLFNIDPMFKDIMIQAINRVDKWNGELIFVYLPAADRYGRNLCRKHMFSLQREKIVSLVEKLNINIIDMTEHFDSQSDPLSLFDGHYNSKGYALVTQKIEEHLE